MIYFIIIWLLLGAASAVYEVRDELRLTGELTVGFIIILAMVFLLGPFPLITHDRFLNKTVYKQGGKK